MNKVSLRFYKGHKVRAVWDEERSKWWFSATDIIGAINEEENYVKAGNYWRWLKKKLNTEGVQLVSVTHDFKFRAPQVSPNGQNRRPRTLKGIDYSYYYEQED